jgi:uncharacterized protein with HEPN domain
MRRECSDDAWLWDMLDSARAVVEMVRDLNFHEYRQDRRTRRAVEREVEIIGEAARKVSESFQQAHGEIPWRKIVAQRHVIAHEYGELQDEILWKVATTHVPALIPLLEPLVHVPPDDPA